MAVIFSALLYGLSSLVLNLANKNIYTNYETLSPVNVLMVQSLFAIVISVVLMTTKELKILSFSKLRSYGIVIPELTRIFDKMDKTIRMGLF